MSSVFSQRTCSVHECALESEIMTGTLVTFYNLVMRSGRYLKRWLKILDVMLEKGKGPLLEKLRTMQLCEADLQLLMRTCIGDRNESTIEEDERILKFNYGSRQHYSIETALLEKD